MKKKLLIISLSVVTILFSAVYSIAQVAQSESTDIYGTHRTIDCNSSHNRNNTVFLLASVHVEQHLKCTSHNPILFGYKISYQRVVHCYAKCGRE